ncbi:hypothetical protein BCR43DRAFT_186671 [Syncephalastrum racemosum]|uniref:Uncharacterized protein n=1 Tax=Syncephalastrum racemosum TaxID=13706 RepID=A0A1X2HRW1_SYNRA|nr:hypothetical protein BCR43DRAFT_186671 [Syncephalastrum racemosum]
MLCVSVCVYAKLWCEQAWACTRCQRRMQRECARKRLATWCGVNEGHDRTMDKAGRGKGVFLAEDCIYKAISAGEFFKKKTEERKNITIIHYQQDAYRAIRKA